MLNHVSTPATSWSGTLGDSKNSIPTYSHTYGHWPYAMHIQIIFKCQLMKVVLLFMIIYELIQLIHEAEC